MDGLGASTCASRITRIVAGRREHASKPAGRAHENPERSDSSHAGRLQVHALAQWIAYREHGNEAARERMDDGNFHPQTKIADTGRERRGFVQKAVRADCE